MHWPSAVWTVKDYEFDEKTKSTIIEAKIVDDNAWNKVKEWVYKWFSIWWRVIEAEPVVVLAYDEDGNEYEEWTGWLDITKLELVEISVVDRPANPDALIETYKSQNANGFIPEVAFFSKETATDEEAETNVDEVNKVLFDKDDAMLKEVRDNVVKFFKWQDVDVDAMWDEDKVEISKADLYNLVKDFVKDAVAEEEKDEASDGAVEEEKEEKTPAEETPAEEEKSDEAEETPAEEEKAEEATDVEKDEVADEVKPEEKEEEKAETEETTEEKNEEWEKKDEAEDEVVKNLKAEFSKMSEVIEKKFNDKIDELEKKLVEKDEKINEMMKKAGFSTQIESKVEKKQDSIFKWLI